MTRAFGGWAWALAAATLFAGFLAGCGTDAVHGTLAKVGEACAEASPCVSAAVCLEGTCRARCDALHACGEGFRCASGGCVPHAVQCGDGVTEGSEECDDGGLVDGDGCSSACRKEEAPAHWDAGAWSSCSVGCGDGVQTRSVMCVDGSGTPVPDAKCTGDRPVNLQACRGTECSCTPTSCTGSCVLDAAGEQTAVVPPNCPHVKVQLWGGGGGGGSQQGATGGGGAYVEATIATSAGESLDVRVAEGGKVAGNGGGASSLARAGTALLIAAGGGGGGSDGCSGCSSGGRGGAGGGALGEDGTGSSGLPPYCTAAPGGKGASATAGGAGGVVAGIGEYKCNGEAGTSENGGSSNGGIMGNACYDSRAMGWHQGGGQSNGGGGGGGAGAYGGGGGAFVWTYCGGGGGGGSSWADAHATGVKLQAGHQQEPGETAQGAGAGRGGNQNAAGHDGKVIINWGG